jgi:hypothetical protein
LAAWFLETTPYRLRWDLSNKRESVLVLTQLMVRLAVLCDARTVSSAR